MDNSKEVKKIPTKSLILEGNYEQFGDFYNSNKGLIYRSLVETYKEFKKTDEKILTLYVVGKIHGLDFDTEFELDRTNVKSLKRDIIPYFEEIEDYETCNEIKSLYNELTN